MKLNSIKILMIGALAGCLYSACSLDYEPISTPTELTEGSQTDSTTAVLKDRDAAVSQRKSLYETMRDRQEHWFLDLDLIAEAHSDNAYAGTNEAQPVPFETNSVDASNTVLARDWTRYLEDIAQANVLINGVDELLSSGKITQTEHDTWKAEGEIFRAMMMFDMARLWGSFPVITTIAKTITSSNVNEVYPTYYPPRSTSEECYTQIIKDLTDAVEYAPDFSTSDRTILSKTVAEAMLAKAYAEKPLRDYSKVIQYAEMVRKTSGLTMESDYRTLWGYDSSMKDCTKRNTTESILELQFTTGNGNWATWMFGRQLDNYDFYFTWAKWCTPSRDLIKAFESEGDTIRENQAIVYYACSWSNYYPATHYAFMYKLRSSVNTIYKLRLPDIMLLEAEAYANNGDMTNAAALVNQVRARVGLANLSASASSSKENMIDAVLKERRLELAFEGQRWFDLCRNGKVESVMNAVFKTDTGRMAQKKTFDENSYLMPIPQTALDQNSNLVQNPGY
jgi:hypothetical protein